ncbi:MAG: hypothetical protein ACRC6X_02880 [Culicoidibacterales bacterium]
MEQITRKQRQKQKGEPKEQTAGEATDVIKMTEDQLFKEQKKRLRKQLNSVPTFSVDINDMKIEPNALKKRTEIKKQKKIDEILKDIAILPDSEYLNEDTNLRILKKLSVAKGYNRLSLSPEQEEKMEENKQKFETITNQLWFLIQDLEKRKAVEPEIGKIPMVSATKDARAKRAFDIETEKTLEHRMDTQQLIQEVPPDKINLIEEKLETISLVDNELEDVLKELEKVVQEGKQIAKQEVVSSNLRYELADVPDDTLELLDFLQKIGDDKQQLTEEFNRIQQNAKEAGKNLAKTFDLDLTKSVATGEKAQNIPPIELKNDSQPGEKKAEVPQPETVTAKPTPPKDEPIKIEKESMPPKQDKIEPIEPVQPPKEVKPKPTNKTKEKAGEGKQNQIKTSIILLAIIFLTILLVLCIVLAYMLTQGKITI